MSFSSAVPTRRPAVASSRSGQARRAGRGRRLAASVAAALVLASGSGVGPLVVASASAQSSSAWSQQLGPGASGSGATSSGGQQKIAGSGSGSNPLDVAPNFNAPGVKEGSVLIGWAKAGLAIVAVLSLTGGLIANKALKEAGNHNASGVRTTTMGILGGVFIASFAGSAVWWMIG
jgi:hypothetical protein